MYKLKFDEIIGESILIMNVEFLGIDRETKQNKLNPLTREKIFKRGVEWEDSNNVTIADRQFVESLGSNKNMNDALAVNIDKP